MAEPKEQWNQPLLPFEEHVGLPEETPDRAAILTTKEELRASQVNMLELTASEASTSFQVNQPQLQGYQIQSELGHGGMGAVYQAYDENLDQIVAIKMMHFKFSSSAQSLKRFRLEARLLARLRHDHIIRIFTADLYDGHPYFVMEYHSKGPLSKQMKDFAAPERASRLVAQIASAVDYAHREGVLHRDLKPANVLIDTHGRAVVSDFGLAKMTSVLNEPLIQAETPPSPPLTVTAEGSIPGTPAYMAPELYAGKQITAQADIWSMGVILYELLAGHRPFVGVFRDLLAQDIMEGLKDEPHRLEPAIPLKLSRIIRKCLMKDPAKRYSTAGELAHALEQVYTPKSRRAFLIASGLLLASGGIVLGNQFKRQVDLDQRNKSYTDACQNLRRELQLNKSVNLLGGNHLPRAYQCATGSPFTTFKNIKPGNFSQLVKDTLLVDLLDSVPASDFQLKSRLKLNHVQSQSPSRFAFYFSRELARVKDAEIHVMYAVMLDQGPDQIVRASLGVLGLTNDVVAAQHITYLQLPIPVDVDIMSIVVSATKDTLTCIIDDKYELHASRQKMIDTASRATFLLPPDPQPVKMEDMNLQRKQLLPLNEAPLGLLVYRFSFEMENLTLSLT